MITITTLASRYDLDTEAGTITRLRGQGASDDVTVSTLEADGLAQPLVGILKLIVGERFIFVRRALDGDRETVYSTNVVTIDGEVPAGLFFDGPSSVVEEG